jgi:hypothetical protein
MQAWSVVVVMERKRREEEEKRRESGESGEWRVSQSWKVSLAERLFGRSTMQCITEYVLIRLFIIPVAYCLIAYGMGKRAPIAGYRAGKASALS